MARVTRVDQSKKMWLEYRVVMTFNRRLCGSVPMSRELIRPWLEARAPKKDPEPGARGLDELEEEVAASVDETQMSEDERVTLGFQADSNGLFVRSGTIKAHIKDCANQIKDFLGIRNLRSKVANKVYIEEDPVYIMREGEILDSPDEEFERPVHVMTAQGPRSALKRIWFVSPPSELSFTVKLLNDKGEITEDVIRQVFDYGGVHGYGGERGMGEGKYEWVMEAQG
jgi:hypothetical protein